MVVVYVILTRIINHIVYVSEAGQVPDVKTHPVQVQLLSNFVDVFTSVTAHSQCLVS